MKVQEHTALTFMQRHITTVREELFSTEEYEAFLDLVSREQDVAAMKEYVDLTGADIEEAHLAYTIAKTLNESTAE